jgi:hypothetical protein
MAVPALTVSEHMLETVIDRLATGISSRLERPIQRWMTVKQAADELDAWVRGMTSKNLDADQGGDLGSRLPENGPAMREHPGPGIGG